MVDIGQTLLASFQGVIRVLLIGVAGFIMQKFEKVIHEGVRHALSRIAYLALLPALIWVSLMEGLSTDRLDELILMPLFSLFYMGFGCGLGYIVALFVEKKEEILQREHIIAATGFANHGYLPLVLAPAVLQTNPFGKSSSDEKSLSEQLDEDDTRAIGITSLFIILPNLFVWSVCYRLLRKATEKGKLSIENSSANLVETCMTETNSIKELQYTNGVALDEQSSDSSLDDPAIVATQENNGIRLARGEKEYNETGVRREKEKMNNLEQNGQEGTAREALSTERHGDSQRIQCEEHDAEKYDELTAENSVSYRAQHTGSEATASECNSTSISPWKRTVQQLRSPPLMAVFVGVVFGLVNTIKQGFINEDDDDMAPLEPTVTNAARSLGNAVMPVVLLILGANISDQIEQRNYCVRKTVLFAISIAKLLIMPLVGLALVLLGVYLELIKRDRMVIFILLIQSCTPPAMNLIVISELLKFAQGHISYILFVLYMVSIATMTFWISVFIYITDSLVDEL